jgi:chromosome segregation ATPase
MNLVKTWRMALVAIFCAAIGMTASAYRVKSHAASGDATGAQDTVHLERRISLLEQRFYSIETSINRLEQQATLSQRPSTTQSSGREMEFNLLRAEVETLRRRLSEMECGLLKLDERTATTAGREPGKRANVGSADPCRLNPETPVQLSTRPSANQ